VGEALTKNATVLVTQGAAQSNHARQTAAAAALAGMRSVLVLDTRKGSALTGNLLLDHVLGADVRLVGAAEERGSGVQRVYDELIGAGETPYIIPTGGSVAIGALGYVRFTLELLQQLEALQISPASIYFATSSQGTQAGLAVGAALFNAPYEVHGVAVESTTQAMRAEAIPIANDTFELLGSDRRFQESAISIDDKHVGDGYAIPSRSGMEAIGLLARTEAIVLDPVYTGKAFAGLIFDVRAGRFGPDDAIVFLHTGGGPSVFANPDAYAELFDS
jgi:1-aminocyclopropane-1-carboxylate deaminase/D-cysteine desulfhydrase-like pyridoxal-dependent ACC family enzyme